MDNQNNLDAKIGAAWQSHYDGKDEEAINKFLALLEEAPDNVDVYWGLGLAYRDMRDTEQAMKAFKKVKELVTNYLANETGELGRYFMLNRMVDQQIQQMEDFLSQ